MTALFGKGSEINQILIKAELDREGETESVGGISYISSLMIGLAALCQSLKLH
jgi:replicative DNA helicase